MAVPAIGMGIQLHLTESGAQPPTINATVAHSHNSAVSANRTQWSYLATRRGRDSAILVIILLTRFSALRELW